MAVSFKKLFKKMIWSKYVDAYAAGILFIYMASGTTTCG